MPRFLRGSALFFFLLLLAGCRGFEDYQNARARMNSDLAQLQALLYSSADETSSDGASPGGAGSIKVDLRQDSYTLGRAVSGVKSYSTSMKLAADAAEALLKDVQSVSESGTSPNPELAARYHAAFNRESFFNLLDELLAMQNIMRLIQDVCLEDPYSRNCIYFARTVPPATTDAKRLQDSFIELMKF